MLIRQQQETVSLVCWGSHFLIPFSDSQHWDWVAVPSAGRTLPLRAKQWIVKAAIPSLHWL